MSPQEISYQLMPSSNERKNLAIKLNFKNPSLISAQSDLDTLDVVVKESVIINQPANTSANNSIIILPRY